MEAARQRWSRRTAPVNRSFSTHPSTTTFLDERGPSPIISVCMRHQPNPNEYSLGFDGNCHQRSSKAERTACNEFPLGFKVANERLIQGRRHGRKNRTFGGTFGISRAGGEGG